MGLGPCTEGQGQACPGREQSTNSTRPCWHQALRRGLVVAAGSTGRWELLPPCADSSLLRDPGLKGLTTIAARIVPPTTILCLHADKLNKETKIQPCCLEGAGGYAEGTE